MDPEKQQASFERLRPAIESLVEVYRVRCLWFLSPAFVPADREQALRALTYIERYGDRVGFIQARELRECLSRVSSATSVV